MHAILGIISTMPTITKAFSRRCTLPNDVRCHQLWFPSSETSESFEEWNLCNNSSYMPGTMLINHSPTTCKECIFIQNSFNSLSMSGHALGTFKCKFSPNSFSQGTYASSLPLSYRAAAMHQCERAVGVLVQNSWDIFSVENVKLLVAIHILGLWEVEWKKGELSTHNHPNRKERDKDRKPLISMLCVELAQC